ncbi:MULTISPECIES: hypothetical protein [unclassified Ruegeria]|uniref:hypothetical protein n=1 Tax=unclassified Ruegeria TaxID=2625375 RepID=UPI001ADC6326|nr:MULTISPECIES: hypothetical protein [unclassified Ruegeria]MBO9410261.1 hypothetical protein [Ruegeria sp. R8_1]MBO9414520.1 hypothetical protein [Ruegeria sp. R8_2]
MKTLRKIIVTAAPSLVLAACGFAVSAEDSPIDGWGICRANESCFIEFDHLANQETDPFLFLGKTVDSVHPQWKRYRRALRRFPDVTSCLIESEREKKEPNLLKLDWEKVGTGSGAEVCVFRVASSLGTADRTLKWLEYQRFRFSGLNRRGSQNFQPHFDTQPIYQVTARWTIEQYRETNPSWLSSLTGYELIYEYRLILNFDQHLRISGVGVSTPTKLN